MRQIGTYGLGTDEKSTRGLFKLAIASNVDELDSTKMEVLKNIKGLHLFSDEEPKRDPLEIKLKTEDDGLSGSEL